MANMHIGTMDNVPKRKNIISILFALLGYVNVEDK